MQKKYSYITIDLDKKIYTKLKAVQGDSKSRYILVNLIDNNLYYDLSTVTVKIYGVKKDKTIFFNNATIVNATKGQFEIELTNQALAVAGDLKIQILILGPNQEKLSTFSFFIEVVESIIDDTAIESSNEFTALITSLSKLEEWNGYFEETSGKIEEKYTERLNTVSSQIKDIENNVDEQFNYIDNKIDEVATTGTTIEVVKNKVEEMAEQGLIQAYTLGDNSIPLKKLENITVNKPINVLNPSTATISKILYNYTGTLNTQNNTNGAISDFIFIEKGEQFTLNGTFGANSTTVMFFTDKTDSSYSSRLQATGWGTFTFTAPITGYMRCNVVIQNTTIDKVMICRGNTYLSTFVPYSTNTTYTFDKLVYKDKTIPREALCDNLINNDKLDIIIQNKINNETRNLFLTSAYVKKGEKLRIPYYSMILADDIRSLKVKSTYVDGYFKCHYNDFIRDVGSNASDKILLYDAKTDLKITEKDFNIVCVDASSKQNPPTVKNILTLGDSFVQSGYISKGIKDRLDENGLTNFNFIGEKESFGVKHQGQGGYRINDFLLNPTDMRPGFNHNPFWNTSTNDIDLSYYMSKLSIQGYLDYCVIHLGVNDIQNGRTKEQIVSDIKTFISKIHTSYPNCKVIVNCLVPCHYDNRQYNYYTYNKMIFEYNDLLFKELQAITNVIFAPIVTTFNVEYAYPFTMKTAYKGSTETEKVITDYLHPNECGYYMIADVDALCLINLL